MPVCVLPPSQAAAEELRNLLGTRQVLVHGHVLEGPGKKHRLLVTLDRSIGRTCEFAWSHHLSQMPSDNAENGCPKPLSVARTMPNTTCCATGKVANEHVNREPTPYRASLAGGFRRRLRTRMACRCKIERFSPAARPDTSLNDTQRQGRNGKETVGKDLRPSVSETQQWCREAPPPTLTIRAGIKVRRQIQCTVVVTRGRRDDDGEVCKSGTAARNSSRVGKCFLGADHVDPTWNSVETGGEATASKGSLKNQKV